MTAHGTEGNLHVCKNIYMGSAGCWHGGPRWRTRQLPPACRRAGQVAPPMQTKAPILQICRISFLLVSCKRCAHSGVVIMMNLAPRPAALAVVLALLLCIASSVSGAATGELRVHGRRQPAGQSPLGSGRWAVAAAARRGRRCPSAAGSPLPCLPQQRAGTEFLGMAATPAACLPAC